MRFLPLLTVVLVTLPAASWSQEQRPLYNSRGNSQQGAAGSPLYNSGAGGGQPLSLNQITQGKNNAGYSYEREGTGFRPYNPNDYSGISQSAVDAFRAQRALQAQDAEQKATASIVNGHQDSISNPALFGAAPPGIADNPYGVGEKKKQRYDGRDRGVDIPPKVFNSVR